jgi:hypothetical protein
MTLTKKFSALVAVVVIGFFSIFAAGNTYMSGNHTANTVNVTINMSSGIQISATLAPGQTMPIPTNNDHVIGVWIYGSYVPAGVNAVVANPNGGAVDQMWQMGSDGNALAGWPEPDHGTIS